jgi:hypothetical protein
MKTTVKLFENVVKVGERKEEGLLEISKEIRIALYAVLVNLLYKCNDNAHALIKEKTILQFLMKDSRRVKSGGAELRTAAVGLLVSALEQLVSDSVEVSVM